VSFRVIGDVLVSALSTRNPRDEEWEAYVAAYVAMPGVGARKVLAVTEGGGPTSWQRMRLQDVLHGREQRAAVVTTSRVARAVVMALSWFNPAVRAFAPGRLADAFDYLGVEGAIRAEVLRALPELQAEVGAAPLHREASAA
jgi:hypothetical protein